MEGPRVASEPQAQIAGRASRPVLRGRPDPLGLRVVWQTRVIGAQSHGLAAGVYGGSIYINRGAGPVAGKVRECGGFFHVDAVQAAGKLPVDFSTSGAHTLSVSAHKIYGPKGVGALYVRKGTAVMPVQTGGGQERGLRAGTVGLRIIWGCHS